MALICYIIGFIWGIVVSYIINKIYKYYKTKQIVEILMDSIPKEELMQFYLKKMNKLKMVMNSGILY